MVGDEAKARRYQRRYAVGFEVLLQRRDRVLGNGGEHHRLVKRYAKRLRERGIRVRVLTNSLASTDEVAVYAGYAKYQRALFLTASSATELKLQFSRLRATCFARLIRPHRRQPRRAPSPSSSSAVIVYAWRN